MGRQLRTFGQNGCPNCLVFPDCGGHPLPLIYRLGCANFASSVLRDTDDMNPNFVERFWERWRDTDGLAHHSVDTLRPIESSGLPHYIPVVQNWHLRPAKPLAVDVVAIPLFKIIGKLRGGGYGARFPDAATLRRKFGLRENARIILLGVDHDPPLETFWAKHGLPGVLKSLAALCLEVSVPNFSFSTCMTGFQILRNRKRILLVAERLSQADIRVSVHLNANTDAHWAFWLNFLREHPEVSCVTIEFQTGALADEDFGNYTFQQVVNIQNKLRRPLHFLLVGAARFYPEAAAQLKSFSVIDTRPFICAHKRKMLVKARNGDLGWKHYPTQKGASLAPLFEHNLRFYKQMLKQGQEEPKDPEPKPKGQFHFCF